jgi:hypothetical protein
VETHLRPPSPSVKPFSFVQLAHLEPLGIWPQTLFSAPPMSAHPALSAVFNTNANFLGCIFQHRGGSQGDDSHGRAELQWLPRSEAEAQARPGS